MRRRLILLSLSLAVGCGLGSTPTSVANPAIPSTPARSPKNVILMVGDGMGRGSIRAAGLFAHGAAGSLAFENFPHQSLVRTASADQTVTDSAAAATAMACGRKVNNGVLSLAIPGNGAELETVLEAHQARGHRVGLVITAAIEDATPAAFAAHEASRSSYPQIAQDYLQRSRPDLLLGAFQGNGVTPEAARAAGYSVATQKQQLLDMPSGTWPLAGLFAQGSLPYEWDGDYSNIPRLSEMTGQALSRLEQAGQAFFLLVENENIDESGHGNHLERHIAATLESAKAVELAVAWSERHPDTLLVVTSDHETGGLSVLAGRGQGQLPEVRWSSGGHTDQEVGLFARGPGSESLPQQMDNVEIASLLRP